MIHGVKDWNAYGLYPLSGFFCRSRRFGDRASLRNVVIYRRNRTMDIVHKHSSVVLILKFHTFGNKKKTTPCPLVRKRTIPTERPPNFVDRGVSRGQRSGSPQVVSEAESNLLSEIYRYLIILPAKSL
jgi:hypothetical protein